MMNQCKHFSGEKLSELLDGVLPEAERLAVEAHLADCADCRRERDALLHVIESVGALPTECVSDGFRQGVMDRIGVAPAPSPERIIPLRRYMVRALPIAATLLVAVGVGLTVFGVPGRKATEPRDLTALHKGNGLESPVNTTAQRSPEDGEAACPAGVAPSVAAADGVGSEHDTLDPAADGFKKMESPPVAALMDVGLAECAKDANAGVHQTLTMEADDPDALAKRAVAAAAGLGVNATIVPSAKKLKGAVGDIRVRLTIPRAKYEELLTKLASLTPLEQRQLLENASESKDDLLAQAPKEFGQMRRKAMYRSATQANATSRSPRTMHDGVQGTRHRPQPEAFAPGDAVDSAAMRGQGGEAESAAPPAPGVSLAVAADDGADKETAWITLIIRVVPPRR